MADLVFSNSSIQKIGSNVISYTTVPGAVQQDATQNTLHLNASQGYTVVAGFEYNWSAGTFKTNALQFNLTCTPDVSGSINRVGFYIDVVIGYYKVVRDESTGRETYEPGRYDTIRVFPYFVGDYQGYINSHILSLDNSLYIRRITVYYCNADTTTGVTVSGVSLFSSISMNEKIAETVGFTISLSSVCFYRNAFELQYNNSDSVDRFYWVTGVDPATSQEVLAGIDINHQRVISITDSEELLE